MDLLVMESCKLLATNFSVMALRKIFRSHYNSKSNCKLNMKELVENIKIYFGGQWARLLAWQVCDFPWQDVSRRRWLICLEKENCILTFPGLWSISKIAMCDVWVRHMLWIQTLRQIKLKKYSSGEGWGSFEIFCIVSWNHFLFLLSVQ